VTWCTDLVLREIAYLKVCHNGSSLDKFTFIHLIASYKRKQLSSLICTETLFLEDITHHRRSLSRPAKTGFGEDRSWVMAAEELKVRPWSLFVDQVVTGRRLKSFNKTTYRRSWLRTLVRSSNHHKRRPSERLAYLSSQSISQKTTMNDHEGMESSSSDSEVYESSDEQSCKNYIGDEFAGDSPSKRLQIVVKQVGKRERDMLNLKIDPSASVLDLKTLISEELSAKNDRVPVDRQRLVYFGRMLLDNEEVLGSKGIKMQTEKPNYIHLSPLPAGAKPSKRSNRSCLSPSSAVEVATSSLQSELERARRFGAAARERGRRRRRSRPYPLNALARTAQGGSSSIYGEDPHPSDPQPQEPHPFSFSSHSAPASISLSSSHALHLPPGLGAPSMFSQLLPSSPLPSLALSASVAAATRASLIERARQTSADLIPCLTSLQAQLRRIGESPGLDGLDEHEVFETVHSLDRVSREAGALAMAFRTIQTSPPVVTSLPRGMPAVQVALERVLAENASNPAMYFSGGVPVFLPSPWAML
jgi:hypothetical protein